MYKLFITLGLSGCMFFLPVQINAQESYPPAKVIYDVSMADAVKLNHIFDRASMLQNVYNNNSFDASIVLVIHEGAIPLFAKTSKKNAQLMQRANSLAMGEVIQFRLCRASAKLQGYKADDFFEFIRIVAMADAEIVKLQNNGYAYLK